MGKWAFGLQTVSGLDIDWQGGIL